MQIPILIRKTPCRRDEVGRITHGEVLVVIYRDPDDAERLIVLHDGYAKPTGEMFEVDLGQPVDSSIAGFEALLSVGISNSSQSGRRPVNRNGLSRIKVNDRLLTSMAGGEDDGVRRGLNGPLGTSTLLTVGSQDNDPANPSSGELLPLPPILSFRIDDEYYDLARGNSEDPTPFVANGSTSIGFEIDQINPAQMDMLFFAGLNVVTGVAPVDPPVTTPDPPRPLEPDRPVIASWNEAFSWAGKGNWSVSGVGKENAFTTKHSEENPLVAIVPSGSTVEKAFLYCIADNFSEYHDFPLVQFGEELIGVRWRRLEPIARMSNIVEREVFRADVTEIVAGRVGSGGDQPFLFPIHEYDYEEESGVNRYQIEGEALVVIYSNPAEQNRSILIADGASFPRIEEPLAMVADAPIDPGEAGFEALLSVGIAGSLQASQNAPGGDSTEITLLADAIVNPIETLIASRVLTESAGGGDDAADGAQVKGRRITIGGIADSPDNPGTESPHNGNPRHDDELYSMDFLQHPFRTLQPTIRVSSSSQTLFFVGLNVTSDTPIHVDHRRRITLEE